MTVHPTADAAMTAVITDYTTRGQQHRGNGFPDPFDAEVLVEEPRDQFGPFLARLAVEAVEQPQTLDVDVRCHRANVQRRDDHAAT